MKWEYIRKKYPKYSQSVYHHESDAGDGRIDDVSNDVSVEGQGPRTRLR